MLGTGAFDDIKVTLLAMLSISYVLANVTIWQTHLGCNKKKWICMLERTTNLYKSSDTHLQTSAQWTIDALNIASTVRYTDRSSVYLYVQRFAHATSDCIRSEVSSSSLKFVNITSSLPLLKATTILLLVFAASNAMVRIA